ncbi:MAG: S41 family peptidase [Limnohabitans sp.]|nr:S41 family peptidase [Limnohabitans sp.]
MKFAKIFLLIIGLGQFCFAQQNLTLTKKEMYADFDTLVATIKKVSPHILIKKDLWKYDAIKEMNNQRKFIDTVTNDLSYFIILQKVINAAQDMHTSFTNNSTDWGGVQYERYYKIRNAFKLSIGHIYVDGKYYTNEPFVVNSDTITIGTEIARINGIAIDDYVKTHMLDRTFSYDLEHNKFYGLGFFKNTETIFVDSLTFTFKDETGKVKDYKMPTRQFTKYFPSLNYRDTTRIEFWEKEQILYIRLKEMDTKYKSFLSSEISKYKDRAVGINKIIVDIRDNPGGQDNVWQDLFADLIDTAISYPLKIDDFKNSIMTKEKIESYGVKMTLIEKDKDKFLKKYNLYTIVNTTEILEPSTTSIKFQGKVFVLAENHYSSAGSAMSVANANPNDRLIAVGRKTGLFLGIGFSPQTFLLPNTKLSYRIAPSIEVTNAKSLKDLMHDDMEVFVPYNLEYYKEKFEYKGNPYSKEFLLKYDPFIKEVLKKQ